MFYIKTNANDSDMIDIATKFKNGIFCVWATINCDFYFEAGAADIPTDEWVEMVMLDKSTYDQIMDNQVTPKEQ